MNERSIPISPLPSRASLRGLFVASIIALLLGFAACSGPEQVSEAPKAEPTQESQADAPDVEVSAIAVQDAHVQLLTDNGAAYFTVVNNGDEDDRLVRVESSLATTAETHETVDEDGVLRMLSRPDGFIVPAGGQLDLAPGGKHVMLMGLNPSEEGETSSATLTLHFEHFGPIEVEAHVMRPMEGSSENHDDHHGH